jgi:hypothetical protein
MTPEQFETKRTAAAARRAGRAIVFTVIAALVPASALAWGSVGHRAIAAHYGDDLPLALQPLRANDAWIVQHVTDPDTRKSTVPSEGMRHFIDIDAYPEYANGTLTHDLNALIAQYGLSTVQSRGIAPWAIAEVVDSMSTAMTQGNWDLAKLLTADLCHYVGDLHQPLHCTYNYDGQFTGNGGIHSRYETTMINTYQAQLTFASDEAVHEPSALEAAFDLAGDSQSLVATLLAADNAAKAAAGGSTSSGTYYAELWNRTRAMTNARLSAAAVMTASLVTTAWMDAGMPTVPGTPVGAGDPAPALALAPVVVAMPSPAAGAVSVRYAFPASGPGSVIVFDARGRRVATLAQGEQRPGGAWATWNPRDVASGAFAATPGVYFIRIEQTGRNAETRVVVAR